MVLCMLASENNLCNVTLMLLIGNLFENKLCNVMICNHSEVCIERVVSKSEVLANLPPVFLKKSLSLQCYPGRRKLWWPPELDQGYTKPPFYKAILLLRNQEKEVFGRGLLRNVRLGPEAPRVAAVKKLNLVDRGKCRGFFVKFFAPFSLEIEGRKSAKNFAKVSQHFSPISSKNFARTFWKGAFAKCTPLLAVTLWLPNVLLGPMPWVLFCFLGRVYRNRLC